MLRAGVLKIISSVIFIMVFVPPIFLAATLSTPNFQMSHYFTILLLRDYIPGQEFDLPRAFKIHRQPPDITGIIFQPTSVTGICLEAVDLVLYSTQTTKESGLSKISTLACHFRQGFLSTGI